MKWTHKICKKWDFLSEWQATEDACELAMEFDHYTSVHFPGHFDQPRSTAALGVRRVHFGKDIDLRIGFDDFDYFQTTTMPEAVFHNWTEKPWAMYPSTEIRVTDAFFNVPALYHGSDDEVPAPHEQDFEEHGLDEVNDFPTTNADGDAERSEDDRDPNNSGPDDPPDSDSGGQSSDDDPQALHILRFERPHVFGHVDWRTYHTVLRDAARLVHMPINVLLGFHYLQARLDGLADMEEAVILQHLHDIEIGSLEKLVVFDLVMHLRGVGQSVPPAPIVSRKVKKVIPQLARVHVLALAGVDDYCDWVQQQCVVRYNNLVWHPRDQSLRDVVHGTYIKVEIPPPPSPHWNTEAAVRVARDVGPLFGFPEASELASQILSTEFEATPPEAAGRPLQHKPCEVEDDVDVPMTFPATRRLPIRRPRHDGDMSWLDQLAHIFRMEAEIEVVEGPPLLYLQTWFVHHQRHPRCEVPRPLRIDNAMITWLEELRFTWRDQLDRTMPFSIRIIHPRPPQPRYHGYGCHVLLEQAQPLQRVAGITTQLFEGDQRDAMTQFAISLPRFMRAPDVTDELALNRFCDFRRCSITVAGNPLHAIVAQDVESGFSMIVRIAAPQTQLPVPPNAADEHFVDVSFLQLPLTGSWSKDLPIIDHAAGPSSPRPAHAHILRAEARPFVPGSTLPHDTSEFVYDLHQAWTAHAWSWEQEAASTEILVWFADHAAPMPHGLQPRRLRLWPDTQQWEEAIQQAWADSIVPGAPLEFNFVEPTPPRLEPGIAAHVILVQHPREDWVTSLVTLFDSTGAVDPAPFFRRAATTFEHIYLEHLIVTMGYADSCLLRPSQFLCQGWYHGQALLPGRPIPGRSGYSIVIQVQRTPVFQGAIEERNDQPRNAHEPLQRQAHQLLTALDSVVRNLQLIPEVDLQCFAHVENLTATSASTAMSPMRIPMTKIKDALEQYDQQFLVPQYHLKEWEAFTSWTQIWWDCVTPITDVWIYHDGSHRDVGSGAAAVAFLRQTDAHWVFGGAVSITLSTDTTSYGAELRGGVLAVQFGIDILKIATLIQASPPAVHLFHDNTSVGNQIFGNWNAKADFPIAGIGRHLLIYAEHRFGSQWTTHYVAGHTGDLGNELADGIAGLAAEGRPIGDADLWLQFILAPHFSQHVAWFWLFYSQQFSSWWDGLDLCLPHRPTGPPSIDALPMKRSRLTPTSQGQLDCTIGTCNVLTLRATGKQDETDFGLQGPTRQQIVFQQLLDARVCIVALQETRLRQCQKQLCGYMLFRGDASQHGHHGIIVAISTTIPYGHFEDEHGRRHDLLFSQRDVSIVCMKSRYVILRLQTPWLRCLLIAGHAPHTGHTLDEIEQWWSDLGKAIPHSLLDWPIVLMVDANAKVGDDTCDAIGDHGAERGGDRALPFTSFIREHGLWLPATFPCHDGPTGTWRHPSGSWHRNDYIGLPMIWSTTSCRSWTSDDIDVSLQHDDHRPALVHIQMPLHHSGGAQRPALAKCTAETADLTGLRSCRPAGPELDVHAHASLVQDQVLACLPRSRPAGPVKLKQTMSEATWALVSDKKKCRQTLREAHALQRGTLLQVFFVTWRQLCDRSLELAFPDLVAPFDKLLVEQDRLIAKALEEFRILGRLVTRHSRQDDILFFQNVLAEGSHCLGPHQSKDLWKVIKRALPKYRQRRLGIDPLRLMALEAEWNPHFEALEAGCVVAPDRLLVEAALPAPASGAQAVPTIEDLPTLFELEHTLRANRPGRATGNDPLPSALFHNHAAILAEHAFPLMLKMWIWGEEPIQYKGGPMALIPKTPQPVEVKHFRGILLLPTLAKSFHALLRRRLIKLLDHQRLPGQLGGFAGQEVLFGSQTLRLLGRTAAAKGLSIGVLFVDLSTAFHCLVREMVVGIADERKLQFVLDALHWSDDPGSRLQLGRAIPCLLEQLGAPAYLIRLMQNIHDSTWTTINGKDYIRTHRGTRPGSPIADVIFHYIMFDFSTALHAFLSEHGYTQKFARHLAMEIDMIIWSDDLAVPVMEERAADLLPSMLRLLDFVKEEFARRGFQINLARGKTGIVATFCGADAASARRQFQLIPQPGTTFEFSDGTTQFVHMSPAYRHLGTLYTSDQTLDTEISHRLGMARSAFEQLRRRILVNRHLPLQLRLQLFSTLILTKLYFAAGSWHTPTGRQLDRIRAALGRMVKAMMGPALRFQSTARLLSQAGILEPRVRLAVERLLYAQRLYHHGPAFLQLMTHEEAAQQQFSWLAGLRHDLRWLYGVEAVADPSLIDSDMTVLIDSWQQGAGNWKARVRRASRRHLFQDVMILEVQQWHADIFQLLRRSAFTFDPDPALLHLQERQYQCPDCDRSFSTPQGVHTHRRKKHGIFCPEHHLLDSATCPACLTFLWNTQRLQQHLSYMPRSGLPNPCFAYLQQVGYAVSYSAEHIPRVMHGQSRLDALPAAGPFGCGPTALERRLAALQSARLQLAAQIDAYVQPDDPVGAGERLGDILTAATLRWFSDFCTANHRLSEVERPQDRWIDILCKLPTDFESWVAQVFILWGRHTLPDIIAGLMDGEAEAYLDAEYADLAVEFEEYWQEARLRSLDRQIAAAQQAPPAPLPHRPVRPPQKEGQPRSVPQLEVHRLFLEQEKWQTSLDRVNWQDMPSDPQTPFQGGL